MYYGARWYDTDLGRFIQPDTLVPNPGDAQSFDRYAYVNNNPLNRVDPTGHTDITMDGGGGFGGLVVGRGFGQAIARDIFQLAVSIATVTNLIAPSAQQTPAVIDSVVRMADQGTHSSAQQNAGNSNNTGSPNGWDPNDPWNSFRNSGMAQKGIDYLQKAARRGNVNLEIAYNQYNAAMRKGVEMGGHALVEAQQDRISTQRITDTFTGVARNTQYFWQGGNAVQWSSDTKVALIIDKSTRLVTTVYERASKQSDWLAMSAFEKLQWLGE